jgi:hypothetical protein
VLVSGHVHQFRILDLDHRRHVWAPTTWAVLPDGMQDTFGAKRCGIVALTLGRAGRPDDVALVEPPGLAQHTLTVDVPSPYGAH